MNRDFAINTLGTKLVNCEFRCDGIVNSPERNIIPRCLVYEKGDDGKACVLVGLNPGKASNEEKEYYRNNGNSYESYLEYFNKHVTNRPYYRKTRNLLKLLGFSGDFLWTELVKCESINKKVSIPLSTLRKCINTYLVKEIDFFECDTIIGLGKTAFNYCTLAFPNHFVVGIPHPTGSYGNFSKLVSLVNAKPDYYIKELSVKKDNEGQFRSIHLSDI